MTQFTDSTDISCWCKALERISSVYQTDPVTYKGKNVLGLSFEEIFALVGKPKEVVSGKFGGERDDRILYRDFHSRRNNGYIYYEAAGLSIWFTNSRVSKAVIVEPLT